MRVSYRWIIPVLLVLAASPAVAGKIGFVDAEHAVMNVEEGKAELLELEAWAAPARARVEELGVKVNEIRQKIAAQANVASDDALRQLGDEEIQARRAFEDARRDFERRFEAKQNEFLGDVAVKVGAIASAYGQANDFDAIFVLKAQPVIYVSEAANLTETVIRLYNERYPVD